MGLADCLAALDRVCFAERSQLPLWVPVCLACGIALYFGLPVEPPVAVALGAAGFAFGLWRLARRAGYGAGVLALALLAATLGFGLAQVRTQRVAAPVLASPIVATVEGRVRDLTRTARGAPRLLLDRVTIHGLAPEATPARLRITVSDPPRGTLPGPGAWVTVHARLSAPGAPVEPGGFDFRRIAWFDRLGGIGTAEGAVLRIAPAAPGRVDGVLIAIASARQAAADAIRAVLPGATGSFTAAILVGDRSAIPPADTEALRISSLAHLLSISGLHMGLLTGIIFVVVRVGLALVPAVALRLPTKKLAAVTAMAAGLVYLLLSGADVAAQRSYLMVLVMLGAVLLDRPAITLRGIAAAAVLILVLLPESLMEVGFQMSFAATVAIVAAFEWLAARGWGLAGRGVLGQVGMTAMTSLVAGSATAPFAAYAFHTSASYGLIANMLAVPLMGLWIMPLCLVAVALTPVGLHAWPLVAAGWGVDLTLDIAHWVAALPGAVRAVPATLAPVLVPIALGGCWLLLWSGRWRLIGLIAIAGGIGWWALTGARPDVLVAASGLQVGVMGPEGRAILTARRDRFLAEQWLAADGDRVEVETAAARPGLTRDAGGGTAQVGSWSVTVVTARQPDPMALRALCGAKVLLIAPGMAGGMAGDPPGPCRVLDGPSLRRAGSIALSLKGDDLVAIAAADAAGLRPWTGGPLPLAAGAALRARAAAAMDPEPAAGE